MSLHSPSPPQPADLPGLRRWVVAFCLIRFDLEQGQVLESSFPPDSLSPSLELQVAFNSFPDSTSHHLPHNRSSIHDSIFFFRTHSPSPSSSSSSSSSFLYGFVFNRQRHDHRLKRGGEQRSVVILSHLPFPSVFRPLLQILAPLCFELGPRALPLVASHVAAWPPPSPGLPSSLPIGSATLRAALPPDDVPSSFPDADLFGSFRGVLLHLWHLWELVVIGEPILVIAPTPPQCSEAIAALVGLASPLPCSLDFRPYFTIHDPDFARLNSLPLEGEEFPPMVLGVTNLFFLKALRAVPHVVSVGCVVNHPSKTLQHPPRSNSVSFSAPKFSPLGLLSAMKMRRDGPLCLMTEHREAVWSSYSATTKPDTSVLNRLVDAGVSLRVEESMSVVNNEILRRHFSELSTNFLAPFGPYLRAAAPLEGSSPYAEPPPLPAFKADEFLRGLAARGPGKFLAKRMRANWLDLYKRFLTGRNFMPWFQRRRAVVEQEQHRLWRQARANLDIHKFILMMSEVEIVDCFHAIEHHLLREIQVQNSGKGPPDSSTVCQKLKADLQAVYNVLPKDMQQLLFLNPQRASLLRGNLELTKVPGHPSVDDGSGLERPVSVSPR